MDEKWRFPPSNHGERKGISDGDTETFMKSPYQAFAREVIQNSIDARDSDEEPVEVVISKFEIPTNEIPGLEDLKKAFLRCKEFWIHKKEYVDSYDEMIKLLESHKIVCLRISDYNTTGLIGVNSPKHANNNFLALTRGTGVSEKNSGVAGGSKGVGKNAAFLLSNIRTVFYSTHASKDLDGNKGKFIGSVGVAELVSGYLNENHTSDSDYTQGTGYFSNDENNSPLPCLLSLDKTEKDRDLQPGTDIYIIGFLESDERETDIINSLLDSFMATIIRGYLEVTINGIRINKDSVEEIVYNEDIIYKNQKANIISQYRLLKGGDNVKTFDIETIYGNCELYLLPLKSEEEDLATHKCAMIRHPLMKIKDENLGASFSISGMCIIDNGNLGKILREIENPQHIDWETKRIKDKEIRAEIQGVLKSIKNQIKLNVIKCLQLNDCSQIDPNGAGDFLPDVDMGDNYNSSKMNKKPDDNFYVTKPKENRYLDKNPVDGSDKVSSVIPEIGEIDIDSQNNDVMYPEGHNNGEDGPRHEGQQMAGEIAGDNIIFKGALIRGIRYKVISLDKSKGILRIIFLPPNSFEDCYLSLFLLDDTNNSTCLQIESLTCNGTRIYSSDKNHFGPFTVKLNEKTIIDVETNYKGFFGCEVKLYADKK